MTTTVNGITCYVTDITGTVTSFIRSAGMNADEVAQLDASETAAASVAGSQTIDVGGSIAGSSATGLSNDATAYTATVSVDGTDNAVSVVGSAAQTYTTLIAEIDADLSGAAATIVGGNLVITSDATTNDSKISITDVDLFSTLTDYVAINDAVDGNMQTDLTAETYVPNGQAAWDHYSGYVETYDTSDDDIEIRSGDIAALTGGQSPTEAEHNDLLTRVNAMNAKLIAILDETDRPSKSKS